MGGPGVQRSARFARHLGEFGYEPYIFTIRENDIIKSGAQTDESLMSGLPADLKIVRVPFAQPVSLINLLNKLRIYRFFWFFFYPFFWERMALWPFLSFNKAKEIIKQNHIKVVYSSSGPFSSLILARLLKRRLNVKWVADMRDPFTDAYAWSFPSRLHWLISRYFEQRVLSSCDHLIVNTPEVKKRYLERGILSDEKISVITNGF